MRLAQLAVFTVALLLLSGPGLRGSGIDAVVPVAVDTTTTTTVLVVRHAERAKEEGRDPALAPEGVARAEALAVALADAGVTAIYATPFRRTRETAAPLAARLGVEIRETPVAGGIEVHAREVARRVVAENPGGVVLVVGHSNTVPAIVRELTGLPVPELSEDAYGDLFIVQLPGEGKARLIRARFGG